MVCTKSGTGFRNIICRSFQVVRLSVEAIFRTRCWLFYFLRKLTQNTISWCGQLQGFAVDQWGQKNSSKSSVLFLFRFVAIKLISDSTKQKKPETKKTRIFFPEKISFWSFLVLFFFCKKDKNEIENKTKQGPISKKGPEIYLNKLNNCVCSFKAGRDLKQQLIHFLRVLGFKKASYKNIINCRNNK